VRKSRRVRGFTLAEVVLASVIGGVVVLATVGLFSAVSRADEAFAARAAAYTEFATTQRAVRRALLGLVMMPASERPEPAEVQRLVEAGEPPPSPDEWPMARFVIEEDPSPSIGRMVAAARVDGVNLRSPAFGGAAGSSDGGVGGAVGTGVGPGPRPQRLEVVVAQEPIPSELAYAGQSWARVAYADAIVDQSAGLAEKGESVDPGLRGVFDLRPDGFRERVIAGLGPIPASAVAPGFGVDETGRRFAPRSLSRPAKGWTLWWRPVYAEERAARDAGAAFDVDEVPELLVEAVPLVRGLETCRFTAFALDEETGEGFRFDSFVAHASRDLPGYTEVELRTVDGLYANWMFEVGWQVSDEGVGEAPGDGGADDEGDGQGGAGDGIPGDPAEVAETIRSGVGGGSGSGAPW